ILDLGEHGVRECVGQAVRVDGDQADLTLILRIAEPLRNPRLRYAFPMAAQDVEAHKLAVTRIALVAGADWPFLEILAVDWIDHAAAAVRRTEVAEQALAFARQALDRLRLVGVAVRIRVADMREAGKNAVADGERALAIGADRAARWPHQDLRPLAFGSLPACRYRNEFAFIVARNDIEHTDRRELAAWLDGLAIADDRALARKRRKQLFQRDAILAAD